MEEYKDEIQLRDILIKFSEYKAFLLKKKLFIIVFSFLFIVFGAAYALLSDIEYNAELTFVVESEQAGLSLGSMSGLANQFGFDLGGAEGNSTFSQDNVMELLKSRGVIVSTLMQRAKVNSETNLLREHYLKINKIEEYSFEPERVKSLLCHDSINGVIWQEIIKDNLTIEMQSDASNIIALSYSCVNQEFAKEFVEKLIAQMSKMYVSHQTAQANNTLDFLQDRADSVFLELEIAEQEFAKIKDINQRIVKASGRLKELQLMRRVEVLNTMYLEIIKNLELSKITLLKKTPIINIIDEPVLPLEEDKVSKLLAVLFGGFLGFLLSCCYLIVSKLFSDALEES